MSLPEVTLPPMIRDIFAFAAEAGLPVWLVGGCLRDTLLGRTPEDWDFATPLAPDQVKDILTAAGLSVVETGRRHGTLTFFWQQQPMEITTFRQDGPYGDGRHPDWVVYTPDLTLDLSRRDFTINAMAYQPATGLVDPFGGQADLLAGLIRGVGKPELRLQEDGLRVLRAVRFAGCLHFQLEAELAAALASNGSLLHQISRERIGAELKKLLLAEDPTQGLRHLATFALWPYIIPEMANTIGFAQHSKHHHLDIYNHLVLTAAGVPAVLPLRLAALLHDIGKPAVFTLDEKGKGHFYRHEEIGAEMAEQALGPLAYGRGVVRQVALLIRYHMMHLKGMGPLGIKRMIGSLPRPRHMWLEQILQIQKADLLASLYTQHSLQSFEDFAAGCRQVLASGCPLDLQDLAVDGNDLKALGIPPAQRGWVLQRLLAEVIRRPEENRREVLLSLAQREKGSSRQLPEGKADKEAIGGGGKREAT